MEDLLEQFRANHQVTQDLHQATQDLQEKLQGLKEDLINLKKIYQDKLPFKIGDIVTFHSSPYNVGEIRYIRVTYLPPAKTCGESLLVEYRVIRDEDWVERIEGTAEALDLRKVKD